MCESRSNLSVFAMVKDGQILRYEFTSGLNPYFKTRREISHILRLELPAEYFHHRYSKILFYGSGCSSEARKETVKSSLVAQFKSPVEVYSDLMGASRGLLGHKPGIAAILSYGSNSCFYDGKNIVKNVIPGGYLLGDEGSSSYMGRMLLHDIIKGFAPSEIEHDFLDCMQVTKQGIIDTIYDSIDKNQTLSHYSYFLSDNRHHPYCHELICNAFMKFFENNISQYDYKEYPISAVGSVAIDYTEELLETAQRFGATISKIDVSAIDGLVAYHTNEQ